MLEVCLELGFPVFILERSPLVLRDLDLIQAIHQKARAVVAFSIISAPDLPCLRARSPKWKPGAGAEKRFAAMEKLAAAGIPTGICAMPLLTQGLRHPSKPGSRGALDSRARRPVRPGQQPDPGRPAARLFLRCAGRTLSRTCRPLSKALPARTVMPRLATTGARLPCGSANIARSTASAIANRARLSLAINTPSTVKLSKRWRTSLYTLELENAPAQQIWAYRKAAWAVEDLEQDIGLVYTHDGAKGLQSIPNVGPGLAATIEKMLLGEAQTT